MTLLPAPIVYACAACGSFDVEGTAWVHLNSGRVLPDEPPRDVHWCPVCEQETSLYVFDPEQSGCSCSEGMAVLEDGHKVPCPHHGPCRQCDLDQNRCKCSTETVW